MLQLILALILLTIIYVRMIRRNDKPISKLQIVVPVLLGVLSTLLSFALFLGMSYGLLAIHFTTKALPDIWRCLISAFIQAAIPEEIAKLFMMLLSLLLFRRRIKNVYEYILIGAAVGFGFTLLEEFLYGSGTVADFGRLITVAGHMLFGMIMAKYLAYARYTGVKGSNYLKAFFIPVFIHTIYDAFTVDNLFLQSKDDMTMLLGLILALLVLVGLFVLQIIVLLDAKKNANKYIEMKFEE